jgi:peptidylprolyl isomerase
MVVKERDRIAIQYIGTLDDGSEFDSTEKHGGSPLEFVVGAHQVIEGFEQGVLGMKVGQEKAIRIPAEKAYGNHDPMMIKEIPRDKIGIPDLKIGMVLGIQLPTGQQIPATVSEVTDNLVKLDLNHPLSGKALNFKMKLEAILEENVDLEKECEGNCECGSCHCGCGEEEHNHDSH